MFPRSRALPGALLSAILLLSFASSSLADEPVDLEMVARIRDEGFHRSQVMDILSHLTEDIGSRLTGSPALEEAGRWALDEMSGWGLVHGELEPYDFGQGWSFSHAAVHMIEPQAVPLSALPLAWTPGTEGPVQGHVIAAKIEEDEDLDAYRGTLAGKIVFVDQKKAVEPPETPEFERYTEDELASLAEFPIPDGKSSAYRERYRKSLERRKRINDFLAEEKALAQVRVSSRDDGVLLGTRGGSQALGKQAQMPILVMAAEPYDHILRLLEEGEDVVLEIDVRARFYDDDTRAYNVLAEIPGHKKHDEVVMLGAHLDSWHLGTGATDDGAGCAVVMEAVRILQALGVEPLRTIRVALWSGEEQGLLGSRAYVKAHLASRPEPTDSAQLELPPGLREKTWPITMTKEGSRLSAYFNVDNGAGKFRGIYAEENAAIRPIFEAWLKPFEDLGATTVTMRGTWGTDHVPFDEVGLPGYQFIQDERDYMTKTHHTNLDVLDHVQREDLVQASVILASFVYHAAMRPEMLPRAPRPQPEPATPKKAETVAVTPRGGRS